MIFRLGMDVQLLRLMTRGVFSGCFAVPTRGVGPLAAEPCLISDTGSLQNPTPGRSFDVLWEPQTGIGWLGFWLTFSGLSETSCDENI